MVLSITKLFASVIVFISLTSTVGSFELADLKEFSFFWSSEMKYIRDVCDNPPGNYLRTLQYAMDNNGECRTTMDLWKKLKSRPVRNYKSFYRNHCEDNGEAIGYCWHDILMYLETCYRSYDDLDRDRIHLFPSFLASICYDTRTLSYPRLLPPNCTCADESEAFYEVAIKSSLYDYIARTNKRAIPRTQNCWKSRGIYKCCFESTNIARSLLPIYDAADMILHDNLICEDLAYIMEDMTAAERSLRDGAPLQS